MIAEVQKNNTSEDLVFGPVILASDHISAATGKTLTVTISKNGGAFATPAGVVTEIGNGWYKIAANAIDANTVGTLIIHATGSGCDPFDREYDVLDAATTTTLTAAPASTVSTVNVTARSIINMALKLLGVLAPGESAEAADEADAYTLLNGLIDSWGTQRLTIYTVARATYTWGAAASSKTIGASGADFTAQRPVGIVSARYIQSGQTFERHLNVRDEADYLAVVDKTLTSTIPSQLYVERTHPLMILRLFPIPTAAGTLVLGTPVALTQFAALTTAYTFPNGYARTLYYNLAQECIPLFNPPGNRIALVNKGAVESLASLKRQNTLVPEIFVEAALLGGAARGIYNINSDSPA